MQPNSSVEGAGPPFSFGFKVRLGRVGQGEGGGIREFSQAPKETEQVPGSPHLSGFVLIWKIMGNRVESIGRLLGENPPGEH